MAFVDLDGVRLHYTVLPADPPDTESPDTGASAPPAVVMIHGLAANLAFWYPVLAPAFQVFGPVVLYDQRGHGASAAPPSGYDTPTLAEDLRKLLDHLGIQRVHLVAHSHGGMVAVAFALAHPGRVESLILADSRLRPLQPRLRLAEWTPGRRWREALARVGVDIDGLHPEGGLLMLRTLARLRVEHPAAAQALAEAVMGRAGAVGDGTTPDPAQAGSAASDPAQAGSAAAAPPVAETGEDKGGPGGGRGPGGLLGGRRGAARWLRVLDETTAWSDYTGDGHPAFSRADLVRLTQPILVLVAEQGMAQTTARVLKDSCPRVRIKVVAGAGHFFPLSRPAAFLRPALRFLAVVSGRARRYPGRPGSGRA